MVSTVANAIQLGAQMFTNTIYTNHRLQRFIRKESGLIDFIKGLEKILCFKREKIVQNCTLQGGKDQERFID